MYHDLAQLAEPGDATATLFSISSSPGLTHIRQVAVPCRVVVKAAAELIICLMRKAVIQDPGALQQLAASPTTLNFLVSPLMVSPYRAVLCMGGSDCTCPLPRLPGSNGDVEVLLTDW